MIIISFFLVFSKAQFTHLQASLEMKNCLHYVPLFIVHVFDLNDLTVVLEILFRILFLASVRVSLAGLACVEKSSFSEAGQNGAS